MLDIKPAEVTIDGTAYLMELGTVERAELGFEDHGIFGFNIAFDFGGSAQGTGWYSLESPHAPKVMKALLNVFSVDRWDRINGRSLFVLRERPYDLIRGLYNPTSQKYVIIKALFDE
jgi:hypothetical protein